MFSSRKLLYFALASVLVGQTHHIISACQSGKIAQVTIRDYDRSTDIFSVSRIIKNNYQHLYYEKKPQNWENEQERCLTLSHILISECLHDHKNSSLVLIAEDEIAAFVVFRPKTFKALKCPLKGRRMGYVQLIAIDSKCRRRGFGKMLLEGAQEKLREKDCTSFFLHCFNQDSFNFYRRCGFQLLDKEIPANKFTTWYKENEPNNTWQHTLHSLSSNNAHIKPVGLLLGGLIIAYLSYSYV